MHTHSVDASVNGEAGSVAKGVPYGPLPDDPDSVRLLDGGKDQPNKLIGPAISNFAVQYNFQNIAIASTYTLGAAYEQASWVSGTTSAVAFAGAISGQLCMGKVGDAIGRTSALRLTLLLSAGGALASAVVPWGSSNCVYGLVLTCRFLMGVGVGGVYPLSATKTSEESTGATAAVNVASVFFWQVPGQMAPYVVAIILQAVIGNHSLWKQQLSWRLLLGLGVVPSLLAYSYSDLSAADKMPTAPIWEAQGGRSLSAAWAELKTRQYLLGASLSWFLYDVAYYGLALLIPSIIEDIYGTQSLTEDCWRGLIVQSTGLPAVMLTIVALKHYSMRYIQTVTFGGMFVMALVLAGIYHPLQNGDVDDALFAICCLLTFFTNSGVNITTFVLPSQLFEKHNRATLNGVAAASGKMGAVLGAYGLQYLSDNFGFPVVMIASAVASAAGVCVTQLFIPEKLPTHLPNQPTMQPGVTVHDRLFSHSTLGSQTEGLFLENTPPA